MGEKQRKPGRCKDDRHYSNRIIDSLPHTWERGIQESFARRGIVTMSYEILAVR
jgi:hypothetical protein